MPFQPVPPPGLQGVSFSRLLIPWLLVSAVIALHLIMHVMESSNQLASDGAAIGLSLDEKNPNVVLTVFSLGLFAAIALSLVVTVRVLPIQKMGRLVFSQNLNMAVPWDHGSFAGLSVLMVVMSLFLAGLELGTVWYWLIVLATVLPLLSDHRTAMHSQLNDCSYHCCCRMGRRSQSWYALLLRSCHG